MFDPEAPEPDAKDWTWAITVACPECGFDPATVSADEIPAAARDYAAHIASAARGPAGRQRPAPAVWSPLEYACHVRDVCDLFDRRLRAMLTEDDPLFDNWDQDATALTSRYWEHDPVATAEELVAAADRIAVRFASVRPEQWQRPGRRSNGSIFTVETFATYFLHDLAHHAADVAHKNF